MKMISGKATFSILILFFWFCVFIACQNQTTPKISIDLSSLQATKPYTDTLKKIHPVKSFTISFNIIDSCFFINERKFSFKSHLNELIQIIGYPNQFSKDNWRHYIYDSLGLYVNTDAKDKLSDFSFDLTKSPLSEPKNIFKQKLIVDGITINKLTTKDSLKKYFKLQSTGSFGICFEYIKNDINVSFNFISKNNIDTLQNVTISYLK